MVGALLQFLQLEFLILIRAQDGVMLLMHAIDNDNEAMLRALLGRGADPNSTNSVGAR